MRKQVAIYDPYLDTLGGGERYCLTIAKILLKKGYKVDCYGHGWDKGKLSHEDMYKTFNLSKINLNLSNVIPLSCTKNGKLRSSIIRISEKIAIKGNTTGSKIIDNSISKILLDKKCTIC